MKTVFILLLCALLCTALPACSTVAIPTEESGTLRFIYDKENIETAITATDLHTLAEMFNGCSLYSDSPSCGFTADVSLRIGDQTFCFAKDGCAIVYLLERNRYFHISHGDSVALQEILAAYGFRFPCT